MNKYAYLSLAFLLSAGLTACGSSSSGTTATTTTTTTSTTGLALPTEISAVPTGSSSSKPSLKSKLAALRAAADAGTDYSDATTTTYVNEHALEQFDIIEQVLGALAQTHYADASNIGQGAYKSMVAWQDEQNGVSTKSLEPWIVQSDVIIENGAEVTRARAWIEEVEGGEKMVVKAEFKITQAATQDSTGAYSNYGAWTLNVKFGDGTGGVITDYFAASAEIGADGESIIKLHERFPEGGEGGSFVMEIKAILNKSAASGFGKVSFPDWDTCTDWPCQPTIVEAKYAYNAAHMAVQKTGDTNPTFKDRSSITEMTHRYGLFDSATGDNVFKTKSFGFPVFYLDSNGFRNYAYYGAWQGRHELWGGGQSGSVAAGTTVTRDDNGANEAAQTYTVSAPFVGTLVKRSTVDGTLADVLNIPVETWINKNYNLRYNATNTRWDVCVNPNWDPNTGNQTCGSEVDFTSILPLLETDSENNRKFVNMNRWDQSLNGGSGGGIDYVYFSTNAAATTAGGTVAGFYVSEMNQQTGQSGMAIPATLYTPSDGDDMWVNIGGSIYIEHTGTGTTGWVEKKLSKFDERTWTPEFDATGDKDYTLPLNEELYINSAGTNYIVKRDNSSTTVKLEIQTVANPLNVSTFVSAGTVFKSQWNPDNDSTYTFATDLNDSTTFMKLVYASIGDNDSDVNGDPNTGVSVGAVVTSGAWGLVAYVDGVESTTQYNWDYPREGENFGKLTYLIDGDGAYVMLSDPIRMEPLTVTNNAGDSKTLAFQYDGWMHGLPDLFEDLRKNEFVMNSTISDKIINIPAATEATDADDATKSYLIKPLEVSQFLNIVTDPGSLDITVADAVDLNSVPDFVEHDMGDMPVVVTAKYSEGLLIE